MRKSGSELSSYSLSLPANPIGSAIKGERVTAFFDNLLPDSDSIRRQLQQKFSIPGSNAIDLLTAIGRDCVGAIQLLPEHESPHDVTKINADPLTERDIERVLSNTVAAPGVLGHFEEDDLRISIAGAQEKTALLWHQGRWCRPLGATPTTHIFKLPIGLVGNRMADMRTSVENEWLCSRILNAYGIATAQSEIPRLF
ncbi:MAG: HipA N-terminal domain-containing protein [Mariprofundales bacterium]|nr:HipA N-terminal domain-containing protein [Mariprofundales bacterium]